MLGHARDPLAALMLLRSMITSGVDPPAALLVTARVVMLLTGMTTVRAAPGGLRL
jgi:hypothetical protein